MLLMELSPEERERLVKAQEFLSNEYQEQIHIDEMAGE